MKTSLVRLNPNPVTLQLQSVGLSHSLLIASFAWYHVTFRDLTVLPEIVLDSAIANGVDQMPKTIEFNTGRKYTTEGQFIKATLHDDGIVTFMDHSRGIDGQFQMNNPKLFCETIVLSKYDHGEAQGSSRSWADGMMRNGCNARNS